MEFHQQNCAPIFAKPEDIRQIMQENDKAGWGRIYRVHRANLVQSVLLRYSGEDMNSEKTAKALLELNGENQKPAYFYKAQARTDWERLCDTTKIDRIDGLIKSAMSPDATCTLDKHRCRMIDFILYSRVYEWGNPESQTPRERLDYFNDLLKGVGFRPLYLFNSEDVLVQLAVLLEWSYEAYLTHLHSPLKEAMDEAVDEDFPLEAAHVNVFTGHANAYLYRIKMVGKDTDPPCGDGAEPITAWSFVNKFKNEFGRTRVSAYYALYQLMGHRDGIAEKLGKYGGLKTASLTKNLMTHAEAAYFTKDPVRNLANAELTLRRIQARKAYEQAVEQYQKTCPDQPVPGPVDLALWRKGDFTLREFVLERWLSRKDHKRDGKRFSLYYDNYETHVLELDLKAKEEIDRAFMNYIQDVYSSSAQPTTADKQKAREKFEPNHDSLPEGHTIDRDVLLHEEDVSKVDIVNMILFNMNAKQLCGLMPPKSAFGYPREGTADKIVEKIDELLNAMDMPPLHADGSVLECLLLAALYNGLDYNKLIAEEKEDGYPLIKDYVLHEILSPAEGEA